MTPLKPNSVSIFETVGIKPLHHEVTMPTFSDVLKFMVACGQLPLERLGDPDSACEESGQIDLQLFTLYMRFVKEECVRELIPAFESFLEDPSSENLAEVMDGLFDTIWVCQGAMLAANMPIKLVWQEGAWSNLRKIDEKTGEVIRDENGKIQKPADWEKPHFLQIVNRYLDLNIFNESQLAKAQALWSKE